MRQHHRQPPAAGCRVRRRAGAGHAGIHAPPGPGAADRRGRLGRRACPPGRDQGRRDRSDEAAVPPAARARRRALHLLRARLHGRSGDRANQRRLPAPHAALENDDALEPHRAIRPAAHVRRRRRAQGEAARQLRHRLAPDRFLRRRRESADGRVRPGRDAARRAVPDGARADQHRHSRPGRRGGDHRRLFRRARLSRAGRPLRRVHGLLRPGPHRPGVPRHRDHDAPRSRSGRQSCTRAPTSPPPTTATWQH